MPTTSPPPQPAPHADTLAQAGMTLTKRPPTGKRLATRCTVSCVVNSGSKLVSCFGCWQGDLCEGRRERLQDLVGGLGPGEGLGFSFQVWIQAWMSFSRAWTEVCTPRRISLSVSRPNQRSTC